MGSFRVLFLTAGVLPATGMRPIGGWLLDRISGARGGLAGFSPPSLVGFFHDRLGMIWPALHPSPIRTALVDAPTTS